MSAENQAKIDLLVKACQKGNADAFGKLYDIYFKPIHRYVFFKVNKDQVEDIVANVFLKAWSKIKKYKKGSQPFKAWLFRIAHNTVIDHYRTHKDIYELEDFHEDTNENLSPRKILEKNITKTRMHRAIRELSDKYQEVILLKFMNDLSNKEIAAILDMSEGNVRTLQYRALKMLKSNIEHEDKQALAQLDNAPSPPKGFFKRFMVRIQP